MPEKGGESLGRVDAMGAQGAIGLVVTAFWRHGAKPSRPEK